MSYVYVQPFSHVALHTLPERNHKNRRSADDTIVTEKLTTVSNVNKYFTDNTITDVTTDVTVTEFSPYVPGLYGANCVNRAMAYINTHKTKFTVIDVGCACIGNCPSYLAPNPAAARYYQMFLAGQFADQLIQRLRDNALYVAFNGIMVLVGITGRLINYTSRPCTVHTFNLANSGIAIV